MEPTNVNDSQAIDIVAEAEAEAEPLNNENNNHNDDWKNVRSFFLAPSVSANELERTTPVVEQAVIQMVQRMESSDAVQAYCQYQSEKQQDRLDQRNKQSAKREQALREAVVAGDARPYQTALLERAMERNSIVHLGTGAGKTLIALLLVQHYAADFLLSKPKQTLFLVPSVALALQQSTTLAANLPYTVGLACYSVTTSVAARQKLKDCHILVATHGACLDLLAHYADLFHMSNFNLVVLDECHYCTGNHDYAVIMRDYFHTTTPKDRPRILGLTASPLINVKVNHSDAQLLEQLSMLEATLDARIIPLADLVVSDPKNSSNESDNDDTNVHDDEKDTTNLYQKEADETTVTYLGNSASRLGLPPLPVSDDLELHPTRRKEFRQLEQLYDDLGPVALSIYSSALVEELSRNTYEKESSEQFARAVMYLTTITDFCHDTTTSAANDPDKNSRGRTDKLQKLEALLEREMEMRPDAVGLVFVERRVTAMALHHYFQNRRRSPNATMLHANATPKPLLATATTSGNQGGDAGSNPAPKQAESLIAATTATNSGNHGEYPGSAPAPKQACDFDQFADASDDDGNEEEMDCDSNTFPETATHTGSVDVDHFMDVDEGADQFDDAEDDPSFPMADVPSLRTNTPVDDSSSTMTTTIPVFVPSPRTTVPVERSREIPAPTRERVRSGVLVRKPTQLFKILNKGGRQPNLAEQEEARKTWLHQEANIRSVLSDLRRGDINILIATSVVEEGVDVQACSFVLVFDTLKNIKSYIQMKGRARQKDAKFFVFQDSNFAPKSNISLSTAQEMESRVHRFISSRSDTSEEHKIQYSEMRGGYQGDSLSCELQAVEAGIYKARHGTVSLLSAKSLLNRYAMAQPMDPIAHSSRAALTAYLPLYKEFQLVLPSYLSSSLRLVSLPERYRSDSNKSRENAMALMACVRLHKHGLLSERLLPLSRDEIHGRIFQLDESETKRDVIQPQDCSESKYTKAADVFIYQVHQESETLKEFQKCLGFEGLTVAIVAFGPLGEIETYRQGHPQLGEVVCSFDRPEKSTCTQSEKDILTEFFALVMNSRWRRRTRDAYFRGHTVDNERFIPPYFIACTKATGELDWDLMQHLLAESNRTRNEKIDAVRELSDMEALPAPRLWSPQYDETAIYIAYGPSGQLCDSPFPFKKEGITTYKDYFQIHHQFEVPADSQLFIAQRLWELPSRSIDVSGLKQPRRDLSEPDMDHSERYQPCENLARVKLPKHACLEPPLANAAVLLVCTMVPQLLYHMERTLVAKAFIAHCHTNLPILGACLAGLSISKVVAVLTANSCGEDDSYERLEWLGDAVLKLVQTDALIKSIDHSVWMENLHEGDLSCVRSVLGCNKQLTEKCKYFSIDRFILTASLSRGQWTPSSLEMSRKPKSTLPSEKVCADVIEALLGLAYREGGFTLALKVADELHLTVPWSDDIKVEDGSNETSNPKLVEVARDFTGYENFNRSILIEEAFTHPTSLHPNTSSYQRLEWIGDAVLCLAAREWLFDEFPDTQVGDMVLMESSLVANETLAYLSLRSGLQRHLNHRDQTLPARIESYDWNVRENGRGLWGTDPPKAIADVVESLLGAVHVDGGFESGQKAALFVLSPIRDFFRSVGETTALIKHPKMCLLELGGELVSVPTWKEEEYAQAKRSPFVWQGQGFGPVNRNGHKEVASVQCLGVDLVSVSDLSRSSAANRACAIVLAALEGNPALLNRFKAARSRIASKMTEIAEQEQDKETEVSASIFIAR